MRNVGPLKGSLDKAQFSSTQTLTLMAPLDVQRAVDTQDLDARGKADEVAGGLQRMTNYLSPFLIQQRAPSTLNTLKASTHLLLET